MNDTFRSENAFFENCEITDFVLKVAKEELGETEEIRTKCLRDLKKKIEDMENFYPQTDDNFLLKFLRVSKFDVDRALNRLKKYYKHRKKNPEIFQDLYPSSIDSAVLNHWSDYILPHRNTDGTTIFVSCNRLSLEDPQRCTLLEDLRLDVMILDVLTIDPITQICGITEILDMSTLTLRNGLSLLTPSNIRLGLRVYLEGMPARYKAVHFVNVPNACVILHNLIYPFLPNKIRKRITIHPRTGDWTHLHTFVPAEVLPEEYGGKQGPLDPFRMRNLLLSEEKKFRESSKYGYRD